MKSATLKPSRPVARSALALGRLFSREAASAAVIRPPARVGGVAGVGPLGHSFGRTSPSGAPEAERWAAASSDPIQLVTHTVKKSKTPYIHALTEAAIDGGAPTELHYYSAKASDVYAVDNRSGLMVAKSSIKLNEQQHYSAISRADVNRVKVFAQGTQVKVLPSSFKEDTSRDEYPYASTLEGGGDGYWAKVPASENSSQGGTLRGIYSGLKDGDEFDVKLAG